MAQVVKQVGCSGMTELLKEIEDNKNASNIYIMCSGETDDSGQSWCPDCVKGDLGCYFLHKIFRPFISSCPYNLLSFHTEDLAF